jgi:hypothetical protein
VSWLAEVVRFGVLFMMSVVGWYICASRKTNVTKSRGLAEVMNKERIADNKEPLPIEELHKVIIKQNILASMIYGIVFTALFVAVWIFVDLGFG